MTLGQRDDVTCSAVLSPGETFEHWCHLPEGHVGDHECGDCRDVWNRGAWDGDDPEPHEKFEGTCTECSEARQGF